MAAGQKPVIRVQIAKKTDKAAKKYIAAAWLRDDGKGLSGKFEKEVVAIKFSDGTVARAEDVWINFYDERMRDDDRPSNYRQSAKPGSAPPSGAQDFGDDNIPF